MQAVIKKMRPWYIIESEGNKWLAAWYIFMGIVPLPDIILNLLFIAFGPGPEFDMAHTISNWMEIIFVIEILLGFITSYVDREKFETEYTLKAIAANYIWSVSFVLHVLAVFPFSWLIKADDPALDPEQQVLRNVLLFRMLRLTRINPR